MSHQFKPGETGAPLLDHGHPAFPDGTGCGTGMTLREYASIKLRVPESGTPWLDEMIRQAVRRDVATEVLSGMLANCGGPVQADPSCGTNYCNGTKETTVEWAVDIADALLARIGGAK